MAIQINFPDCIMAARSKRDKMEHSFILALIRLEFFISKFQSLFSYINYTLFTAFWIIFLDVMRCKLDFAFEMTSSRKGNWS